MRFLLDTNVVSELQRPEPAPAVCQWYDGVGRADLFLSVVTIGEVIQGAEKLMSSRPDKAREYIRWLTTLRADFKDRLLPVTEAVAEAWGRINGRGMAQGQRPAFVDNLLAATAHVHGLTLATRNLKDFRETGIMTVDPWSYRH